MKIKDWVKLGAGVLVAKHTYMWLDVAANTLYESVNNKLIKTNEKLKDSKPKNEEES